ncbi:hypothetical protein WH95_15440 [Kiloniella litopenaei]|uniref:DUF3142 domain-containing protein n=1 Tax=Kiloniella litopenaei TaxID=1549748 RepID=A0A0M2R8S3_9PROT|nr:DUF3142 domain-containing protein [Kiloniella litopenaei]KKJ75958.1 hypothetical protein WH95_15440 [Kiloniella litopenaei]
MSRIVSGKLKSILSGIFLCVFLFPSFANTQDLIIDHWVWAGQTLDDKNHQEQKFLENCQIFKITCRAGEVRVLVRSWGHQTSHKSIPHQSPRYFQDTEKLILTYRMENRINVREISAFINRDINIWKRAGRHIIGIEIDYDSPSSKLDVYRAWLIDLKKKIPADISVRITGLPTWFEDNRSDAKKLAAVVSEVSLMFYRQKQTPITDHLLDAIKKVNNIRYGFLCNDDRWHRLLKEQKKYGTFRMAIFITAECHVNREPAPS